MLLRWQHYLKPFGILWSYGTWDGNLSRNSGNFKALRENECKDLGRNKVGHANILPSKLTSTRQQRKLKNCTQLVWREREEEGGRGGGGREGGEREGSRIELRLRNKPWNICLDDLTRGTSSLNRDKIVPSTMMLKKQHSKNKTVNFYHHT